MGKMIVWIDDDVDVIEAVVLPLRKAGHEIVVFRNERAAVEAAGQLRQADLILLDLLLPTGNQKGTFEGYPGLDLLDKLREQHDVQTPAVILSVVATDAVKTRARGLNVLDIVRKPVRPSELKQRVEDALAGKRAIE